jgi:hypothetical protein
VDRSIWEGDALICSRPAWHRASSTPILGADRGDSDMVLHTNPFEPIGTTGADGDMVLVTWFTHTVHVHNNMIMIDGTQCILLLSEIKGSRTTTPQSI